MKRWLVAMLRVLFLPARMNAEVSEVCLVGGDAGGGGVPPPPPNVCSPCGNHTGDCGPYNTNTTPYLVTAQSPTRTIPLVFHIVLGSGGVGDVSDANIAAQVQTINDAYGAKSGSPFSGSVNTRLEFVLASTDPSGSPTTGINRVSGHPTWFTNIHLRNTVDDSVGAALHWDTSRYVNVVTHANNGENWSAYPWNASSAPNFDGIRLQYTNINGSSGQDRVAVHEIGHFLALYHEGDVICSPDCSSECSYTGDMLCDTPFFASCGFLSCSGVPYSGCGGQSIYFDTFMGSLLSPSCWSRFTAGQTARMRCSLPTYRPTGYLGIIESSIAETVTTFCKDGNALVKIEIYYETNVATDTGGATDSLQVWLPGHSTPCAGTPSSVKTGTPYGSGGSAGKLHKITYQGPCATGTFKYNIRSRKGVLGTRAMCRSVAVTAPTYSCPSCPACQDPPCELELE